MKKIEVIFQGKILGNFKYENNKQKNQVPPAKRSNSNIARVGLVDEIRANNGKLPIGWELPKRKERIVRLHDLLKNPTATKEAKQ